MVFTQQPQPRTMITRGRKKKKSQQCGRDTLKETNGNVRDIRLNEEGRQRGLGKGTRGIKDVCHTYHLLLLLIKRKIGNRNVGVEVTDNHENARLCGSLHRLTAGRKELDAETKGEEIKKENTKRNTGN